MKKKILILTDWYLPGFKAGGPIQSLTNFAAAFSQEFEIAVFTKNADLHETQPYPNIESDVWTQAPDGTRVFYASPSFLNKKNVLAALKEENFDFLYINSMYSLFFSIIPILFFSKIKGDKGKIIVAARGMLHRSALKTKPLKKKIFLFALKTMGLHHKITWQASDEWEVAEIKIALGDVPIKIAPNLPRQNQPAFLPIVKSIGQLRLAYISRIHPIKNLAFVLERLKELKGEVLLDIYGAKEDTQYWDTCQNLIAALPSNIQVVYQRPLRQSEISTTLANYHFFVLPTLGENFGHAIFDALITGIPLIISDTTPWKQLADKEIGWELPLSAPKKWEEILQNCIEMGNDSYQKWAQSAWNYALSYRKNPEMIEKVRTLFE